MTLVRHRLATLVLCVGLLLTFAVPHVSAQTGAISGTVTRESGGSGIQNVLVNAYLNGSGFPFSGVTNASGGYTISNLSPGTYYVVTLSFLDVVDELYPNTPCPDTLCTLTAGGGVTVSAGSTTGNVNLALAQGALIGGTVTVAATAAPLANVSVRAYNSGGTSVGSWSSNVSGAYQLHAVPAGTYFARTFAGGLYPDELYDNHPCSPSCTVTTGTPIAGLAGQSNTVNFAMGSGAGTFGGTVTDARSDALLSGVRMRVFNALGAEVATATTNGSGSYLTPELPPGAYYARTDTAAAGAYNDMLFDGLACLSDCTPTNGTPIDVTPNSTSEFISFWLEPNMVQNGQFTSGTSQWSLWATPDTSYMTSAVVGGVFEYYRVPPPPSTSNQAVIFQNTGVALDANAPLIARFDVGNSSSVRKRISVLVLDSNFSDLAVCTFWLPPQAPLRTYQMLTHTTKAWTNASVYFYAATAGSDGGAYRLDNVWLYRDPLGPATSTQCVDPTRPLPGIGVDGPTLLTNGDFGSGSVAPWTTYGTITAQVTAGVLEFVRFTSTPPAGVVLQTTGQGMADRQLLTASFRLGNSSGVRKRVTVLLHDLDFSDLAACTFWLPPGQPLSSYIMRTFATKAWSNATLSVYPATTGAAGWILLDDVSFRESPGSLTSGTDCFEPFGRPVPAMTRGDSPGARPMTAASPAVRSAGAAGSDSAPGAEGRSAGVDAAVEGTGVVAALTGIDLRAASHAWLRFTSDFGAATANGDVQVRVNGSAWIPLALVDASGQPDAVEVDLSGLAGGVLDIRFVADAEANWRVGEVAVEVD